VSINDGVRLHPQVTLREEVSARLAEAARLEEDRAAERERAQAKEVKQRNVGLYLTHLAICSINGSIVFGRAVSCILSVSYRTRE
jgi:hypothetical protein